MENKISASEIYAPAFSVQLGNNKIPKSEVARIKIEEDLEKPGICTISFNEFLDPDSQKFKWLDNESIAPGTDVLINFGYASSKTKGVFKGKIKALEPSFALGGVLTLDVQVFDLSHELQKTQNKVSSNDLTYLEVARELAGKNKLTFSEDGTSKLTSHQKAKRRVDENDYDFLKRLANEIGFEFFVRNNTLYFRKPPENKAPEFSFELHTNILSFSPRMSIANVLSEVMVTGWNEEKTPISQTAGIKEIKSSFGFPDFEQVVDQAKMTRKEEGKVVRSTGEAKEIALSELKRGNSNLITGTLECVGNEALRPGMTVNIEKVGKRFNGRYYITGATHTFGDNGYRTTLKLRRCL